ncbi:hypothetical protein BWQ96_06608 [Gracilariopsis chorda]|uniref:Uncharacterized protein n=1 Tax=Gracilariopsis chorda TaxID=448386 RepID=A0A2V3INL9_9FLOR|nr:hypothetical protein BWQ96_06608 [Gracilariopsis chorda]|eukprot:PXF43649.1 hypothetical protein BWQ96_06608 [Gracilariopsis chorda]
MPPTVLVAAAVCSRKIAVEALFRGQVTGVIDVGAADGYPVTSLALSREAKWVLSCENSPKYNRLRRLSGPGFHHINLLPGNSRRNPSIIHVLHTANITGDAGDVRKKTFISRGTISLIAIRGKESDAFLEGAVPILPAVNNVLLEISADRNASSALHILFNAGFECAHLAFNHKGKVHPFFGRNSINAESAGQFLQFMAKHAKFVDVLCSKRATTG